MKRWLIGVVIVSAISALAVAGLDTEYESATDGTAAVVFGPNAVGQVVVKSLYTRNGSVGTVKFYARGGAGRATPTAYPTNGATVVAVANTDYAFTNSDMVVYYHASADVADYRTISSATTSNVTLSSGVSSAGAAGDQLYELTQQGQIDLRETNVLMRIEDNEIFATPSTVTSPDSPLYIAADITSGSDSNITVMVTVER